MIVISYKYILFYFIFDDECYLSENIFVVI